MYPHHAASASGSSIRNSSSLLRSVHSMSSAYCAGSSSRAYRNCHSCRPPFLCGRRICFCSDAVLERFLPVVVVGAAAGGEHDNELESDDIDALSTSIGFLSTEGKPEGNSPVFVSNAEPSKRKPAVVLPRQPAGDSFSDMFTSLLELVSNYNWLVMKAQFYSARPSSWRVGLV